MRRYFLFFIALLLLCAKVWSQPPAFVWAKGMGGTDDDKGFSIAVDLSGNVYTTGMFNGTVDFDPGAGVYNLTSAGFDDIFISKLDAGGNFIWAKSMGGTSFDEGYSIAVDASANVYTVGSFQNTVDFNPGVGTFNLTSAGSSDIFISKLDAAGNFIWVKKIGATGGDEAHSIVLDFSGNIYTTGSFQGITDFNPGAGSFNLTSLGNSDIFISKLDAAGNFVWAKAMGGASSDEGYSITLDASGNILTTGFFFWTADFDPGVGAFNLTSAGSEDIFISKLDALGNFIWAKSMGETSDEEGKSMVTDNLGNVYTTGYFQGTIDFNPGAGIFNMTCTGFRSAFISKLDATGNFVWAKCLGNPGTTYGYSIALDTLGNVYTTGSTGYGDFDPGPGTFYLWTFGVAAYISKLDSAGNFVWAKEMTGPNSWCTAHGSSIVLDSSGNIYTTGTFYGTIDFDPGPGTFDLTYAGGTNLTDIFVHKMADCATVPVMPSTINGDTTICSGSTNSYTVPLVGGVTDYTWVLPAGWTGTSTTNSITATANSSSGNISVIANNPCGSSSAQTLAVTVYVTPAPPDTIIGNLIICAGSTNTYSVTNVTGATDYTWIMPGGWMGNSIIDSIVTIASAFSGNVSITANNAGCSSSPQVINISVNNVPVIPNSIIGDSTVCVGSSNIYSIDTVAGATSYTWTLPGGWSGTSITNSINTTAGSTSGNISVTANNTCGSSSAQTLNVVVSNGTPVTPAIINGNTPICAATINTYDIALVSGATSYSWSLPAGWLGSSITNSITTTGNSTSGNVSVTANNACGSSQAQILAVTVNTVDASASSSGLTLIANATGASYQWIYCGSNTPIASETNQSYTATTNGSYAVIVTQNDCTDTSSCFDIFNVGIMDNGQETLATIYPNPGTGLFTLSISTMPASSVEISMVNSIGQTLYSATLNSLVQQFDFSYLPSGTYYFIIKNDGHNIHKKVIIRNDR